MYSLVFMSMKYYWSTPKQVEVRGDHLGSNPKNISYVHDSAMHNKWVLTVFALKKSIISLLFNALRPSTHIMRISGHSLVWVLCPSFSDISSIHNFYGLKNITEIVSYHAKICRWYGINIEITCNGCKSEACLYLYHFPKECIAFPKENSAPIAIFFYSNFMLIFLVILQSS